MGLFPPSSLFHHSFITVSRLWRWGLHHDKLQRPIPSGATDRLRTRSKSAPRTPSVYPALTPTLRGQVTSAQRRPQCPSDARPAPSARWGARRRSIVRRGPRLLLLLTALGSPCDSFPTVTDVTVCSCHVIVTCNRCHTRVSFPTAASRAWMAGPTGTYSSAFGLEAVAGCRTCSVGHSCAAGAVLPAACGRGRYAASEGSSACAECAPGHEQPDEGQASCRACPRGEWQPRSASSGCLACPAGYSSSNGSAECTFCSEGFYLQQPSSVPAVAASPNDPPPLICLPCSDVGGVECHENATFASISLHLGYWRHGAATEVTYRCRTSGEWSPCAGGSDAGTDGVGYCASGFHGPKCEVCVEPSHYFDSVSARCRACGDVAARAAAACAIAAALGLVILAAVLFFDSEHPPSGGLALRLHRKVVSMITIWKAAGMQCKLKTV